MMPGAGTARGRIWAAAVACAVLSACGASDLTVSGPDPEVSAGESPDTVAPAGPVDGPPTDAAPMPPDSAVTLVESSVTGVMEPRRALIRSADEWEAVWAELTGTMVPNQPAPELDFGVTSVVLVAMGSRPTGGYVVEITSVTAGDDTLYVTVRETSPGPECIVTQALTSPALAVLVPRVRAEASFLEETATTDCG